MNITRIYAALLQLYPARQRALFATEMSLVFQEAAEEQHSRGRLAFFRFAVAELIGLLSGAAIEWIVPFTHRPRPLAPVDKVTETQRHLEFILSRMDYSIAHHQFQKVRFLAEAERRAREKLRILHENRDPKA